uniref:Uncharacterized protein n=1 Tax=Physcomitrium patens TaxID=3218 RepID=A0A2K1KSX5_PHYPA|nr:hypothetical protein PHYPA_003877 [Physcomitrium patens]
MLNCAADPENEEINADTKLRRLPG